MGMTLSITLSCGWIFFYAVQRRFHCICWEIVNVCPFFAFTPTGSSSVWMITSTTATRTQPQWKLCWETSMNPCSPCHPSLNCPENIATGFYIWKNFRNGRTWSVDNIDQMFMLIEPCRDDLWPSVLHLVWRHLCNFWTDGSSNIG